MTEQNEQVQGPWTAEEGAAFGDAVATFRDGLPSRQRDAFTAILAAAAHQGGAGDDTQGHLWWVPVVIDAVRRSGVFDAIDVNAMLEKARNG